jgi:hypothetical protein
VLPCSAVPARAPFFPPRPTLVGRTRELAVLARRIERDGVSHLALVGAGGSGKSLLACALGHRLRRRFPGGVHWVRVGAWDASTLFEIFARRLGVRGGDRLAELRRAFGARALVVLDNHESDRALARFLEPLRASPVVWVITARRCLLSGVEVFPVVAPLATAAGSAFPRVAALTRLLRWNPLALDIADRLVATRAASVSGLRDALRGVDRITVRENEDDVAEVRRLVEWAWPRLPAASRRMLAVLARTDGDDVDGDSLAALAGPRGSAAALTALRRWHLVQEPLAGRFAVHAVVREAVVRRSTFPAARLAHHYLHLIERHPERIDLEQTHLFAAMDHFHRTSDLGQALRIERLLARLDGAGF